ncbi:hypothetical protein BKA70DRAFT_1425460 [Coprinopsis sp. MPI-PUGE-AT-0042]|nr:hypothetical protein BKA70DRAFT_1451999 [Coprinopsis sp. MPI-PUGE-AT-0042]KAH6909734.1 hypothetical protein BKA70DRAFT_1425460 [Coprinopsis sp. MPI-PUGE-AT-0042]
MKYFSTPEDESEVEAMASALEEELQREGRDCIKGLLFPVDAETPMLVNVPLDVSYHRDIATSINVDAAIYLHRTTQQLSRVYIQARRCRRVTRFPRNSRVPLREVYILLYSKKATQWGVRQARNDCVESAAGSRCKFWGNLLVCKASTMDDHVLDITDGDIRLVEQIVVSELVDYPIDQN